MLRNILNYLYPARHHRHLLLLLCCKAEAAAAMATIRLIPRELTATWAASSNLRRFKATFKKHGMGLLLDIVPNHMAASDENPWWMDLLENGPASVYSAYFDVDWHPPSRILDNKILLPVLGSVYADALKNQELQVIFRRGSFFIKTPRWPVSAGSKVLPHDLDPPAARAGAKVAAGFRSLSGISGHHRRALGRCPIANHVPIDAAGERRLQVERDQGTSAASFMKISPSSEHSLTRT